MIATPPNWTGRRLAGNWDVIFYWTRVHLRFTLVAVVLGFTVSLLLAYAAHRKPVIYAPLLVLTNIVYAIPSVVMFALIATVTGTLLSDTPVVLAMALYTTVILVRNITEGLRSVPPGVTDAATAMGYRPLRLFTSVELPLALPGIIAGLRVATVSTVSLISVGALLGRGGLGRLFNDGFNRRINIEVWSGAAAIVVLALALDALLVVAGRLLTPWARRRSGALS
jgi:osmoprotectant transport system permease protein